MKLITYFIGPKPASNAKDRKAKAQNSRTSGHAGHQGRVSCFHQAVPVFKSNSLQAVSILENYPGAVFANYSQADAENSPGLWNFEILYFGDAEEFRIFFRSSDPTVPAIRLKLPPNHSLARKNGETVLQFARETAKSGMSELVVVVCGVDALGKRQTLDRAYFSVCLTGMSGQLPLCY